jgi:hypothetical protein
MAACHHPQTGVKPATPTNSVEDAAVDYSLAATNLHTGIPTERNNQTHMSVSASSNMGEKAKQRCAWARASALRPAM